MRKFWLLFSLVLVACSPKEQPHHPPAVEPLAAAYEFTTSDNVQLPLRSWLPEDPPKAVIIALHGFNDYSNAFLSTGLYLRTHGIATFAYDQRGFGKAPERGIWAGEQNLTRDVRDLAQAMTVRYPNIPVFLMGESMGGAVVMLASMREDMPELAGIILVSPAVWGKETMSPFYKFMLWTAAHTMPSHTVTGKDLRIVATNNIPMLRKMSKDPLIIKGTRMDAIYGISRLMDSAYVQASEISTPILLLYGGQDQIIPQDSVISVVKRLPKPFTVGYYEDGYHMLTRDIQREAVLEDIAGWIGQENVNIQVSEW